MLVTLVSLVPINGITNGTIGKTLNGICLPMVPFLPLEKTTNARIDSLLKWGELSSKVGRVVF